MKAPETDTFNLQRFVDAQAAVYADVQSELRAGSKQTHWMWFIFPQLRSLGRSPTARYFGIASLQEAQAYLMHPILGTRLQDCTVDVLTLKGRPLQAIFGSPDDLKFRSCMTLFAEAAAEPDSLFQRALQQICGGRPDVQTVNLLTDANSDRKKR